MPKPLKAHQWHVHRLACLSLYRALLKQSTAVFATKSDGLKSLIRHRFRHGRSLQSPSQIVNGLTAGQQALGLLRASEEGDTDSIARLNLLLESTLKLSESNKLLRNALSSARQPTAPRVTTKTKEVRSSGNKVILSGRPASTSASQQTCPTSPTKKLGRRVPRFVAAHGFPFLVYGKPQPLGVGLQIRQKLAWKIKKWDQRMKLAHETIPLLQKEDDWDALVARQEQAEGSLHDDFNHEKPISESWAHTYRAAETDIIQALKAFDEHNLDTSRKMMEVIRRERSLAAEEKTKIWVKDDVVAGPINEAGRDLEASIIRQEADQ